MEEEIFEQADVEPVVRGVLLRPDASRATGVVLAHGAGSNRDAPLLVRVSRALVEAGFCVLRMDLPFRQRRPRGAPHPGDAARDREGIRRAAQSMRQLGVKRLILGGASYGGRQSTLLAAEDPAAADALLLLAYPLHPPGKPEQLRTTHFSKLRTPCLFFHGSKDPFGSLEQLRAAIGAIPAVAMLEEVDGAGHDLKKLDEKRVVEAVLRLEAHLGRSTNID